jgi:acyl-coenzyme A thioesterase PaaI-like protein
LTRADTVVGAAVQTALEQGVGHATVDVNSKMLKFIPLDQELIAEGRLLHRSRTLAVSEGSIRNGDGVLLAHGTATSAILLKRAP